MKSDPAYTLAPASRAGNALASRLAKNTRGEVLFDAASRGRYATDASIYQIMPVGVFVPADADDVATAIDIARDRRCRCWRAAAAPASAARPSARPW
jgi:FAD/FMN-containing dehydrogenase